VPASLWPELRSDHAGEAGAVEIYRGILAVSRDPGVRQFAQHHLRTESRHLELMEGLVPPSRRSRLLPLWRLAGRITGALPALCGPAAVYRTIAAVEEFVDRHYADQVRQLAGRPAHRDLRALLEACRADEAAHRDDALGRTAGRPSVVARIWARLVGVGSAVGVALARRV
jgi:ubiquinone biosynthesis monooxygenase Coq7